MEYILTTHNCHSFSRAAEQLYISQPALSAIVAKEEARLGVELFNRHTKPLQLTPAGETYIKAAKKIANIEKRLLKELQQQNTANRQELRFCSYAFLITHYLTDIVQQFQKEYQLDLKTEFREKRTEDALPLLQKGKADFVITTHARRVKGCASVPLLKEKVVLAVPAKYPINSKLHSYGLSFNEIAQGAANNLDYPAVALKYFADYPFILHYKTKEMYRRARRMFTRAGISPKIVASMDDFLLMYFVALAGQGISFMREGMIKYMEPSDKLIYYKIDDEDATYWVNVYYRSNSLSSSHHRQFLEYVKRYWGKD